MTTITLTRPIPRISDKANDIIFAILIGIVLTGLSYLVATGAGWITEVNPLEAFAVFTSYGSTWLCVKQRRFNYVFGAISTAAYALLFFQYGLIASALLNAYLAPALVYGWFRWRRDSVTRPVTWVSAEPKWIPVYLLVTAAAYGGAVWLITAVGGQLAFLDAGILALTILAQFLLDNKRIETWIIWALVNVLAIYVYFTSGLPLVGFQYIFFLVNTGIGFWQWKRSMTDQVKVGVPTRV